MVAAVTRSLSRRVMWVLFAVCLIAFLTTALLLSFVAAKETYGNYKNDLVSLARVLATNCQASLAFGLSDDAKHLLMGLKARPSIVAAAVLDKEGRIFSTYAHVPGKESLFRSFGSNSPAVRFIGHHLFVGYPVVLEGEPLGCVVLEDDLSGLRSMLDRLVGVGSAMLLALLLLFFLLSRGFQRLITAPILQLADAAQRVAKTNDYSVRISSDRKDELGMLVASFNHMLDQIERKEAERRESEQRFQAVFNQSFQFMAVISLEGELLDVNETIQAFCGRNRAELLELHLQKAPWWRGESGELERVRAAVAEAAEGRWTRFETEWIGEGGTTIFVDCSFKPVVDPETGENLFVVLEARDITSFKKAQDALRVSELRYRELFNSSMDAILVVEDGRIADANKRALELTGVTPRDLLGRSPQEFIYAGEEGEDDLVAGAYRRAVAGEPQTFEARLVRIKGEDPWVEVRMHRVSLGHRETVQIALRDISEKKAYEMELNRLASAVHHAAEAMLILDNEAHILYANPAFFTISGYGDEEIKGEKPLFITDALSGSSILGDIWRQVNRGRVWMGRLVCHRRDGTKAQCDATISPIFTSTSRIGGFVAILRDITQQLKIEEKMRQTQKLEAIGTLAGGIAHDFNNILAAIFGNTELALASLDDREKVEELLQRLLKSAGRARDLVQQILTFSRQKEGQPRPVAIQSMVKEALKLIRSTFPANIEVKSRIACDAMVVCDPVHVHQVVMNLCTNAAHAMSPGGGVLTVGLERVRRKSEEGEEGDFVCLTVSDTGIGIPEEDLDKIFDPFFTTKPDGEGTGLGLSIVHGIVKGAGGEIVVESTPGEGTTFQVYLPVAKRAELPECAESEGDGVVRGGGRILFVDDEEMIREVCKEILTALGFQVDAVGSGQEALERLAEANGSYDIVITDLSMPKMDGIQLAEAIKERYPAMPVILSTGYVWGKRQESWPEDVVDATIQKPYKSAEVVPVIRSVLGR